MRIPRSLNGYNNFLDMRLWNDLTSVRFNGHELTEDQIDTLEAACMALRVSICSKTVLKKLPREQAKKYARCLNEIDRAAAED